MIDLLSRDSTILRDSLLAVSGAPADLLWSGVYKIFLEDASDDVPLPYVTNCHVTGGYTQPHRTYLTEAVWEVIAHAADLATALRIGGYIQKLHNTMPVVNVTGHCAFSTFEVLHPIVKRYVSQNHTFFQIGAMIKVPIQTEI